MFENESTVHQMGKQADVEKENETTVLYRFANKQTQRSYQGAFIFIIVYSILIRVIIVAEKHIIYYDDALSYLMATGHTGAYRYISGNDLPPIGEWSSVASWKRFIEIEDTKGYLQISHDIANYDIHPPLYFWALHFWLKSFGVTHWIGSLFNILIDIITAIVLFLFVSHFLKNNLEALLISSAWILSPISIQTASWVRQYSLFSLIGLLFALSSFAFVFANKKRHFSLWSALLLIVIMTAGLLLHYHFIFFVVIAAILIFIKTLFFDKSIKPLIFFTIVLAIALSLSFIIYPNFFISITRYNAPQPTDSDTIFRIKRIFFIGALLFSPVFTATLLLILNHYFYPHLKKRTNYPNHLFTIWMVSFAAILWIIIIVLFLIRKSPQHAMGAKYVSFITPFVASIAILILRYFSSSSKTVLSIMLVGMIFLSLITIIPVAKDFGSNRLNVSYLQNADNIVLDNVDSGMWPAIIFHLQEEDQIFLARQEYLRENTQEWLPRFCNSNSVYISFLGPGISLEGTEAMIDLISNECNVALVSETAKPFGIIKIYKRY